MSPEARCCPVSTVPWQCHKSNLFTYTATHIYIRSLSDGIPATGRGMHAPVRFFNRILPLPLCAKICLTTSCAHTYACLSTHPPPPLFTVPRRLHHRLMMILLPPRTSARHHTHVSQCPLHRPRPGVGTLPHTHTHTHTTRALQEK